jgi:uroporphyrin-III C-methyltransferase/precorrin-2 dehydrogenase/sirohydrochlorin ferrochelatase
VHDRLVDPAVLDLARRDAARIDVGKQPGRHGYRQVEINALLVKLARDGQRVVRLKGGDPTLFARGGEELAHLRAHGVAVELVPGITAATGCAAAAGFALTHRAQASAVTLISGQAADGEGPPDLDWAGLARGGQTLVIYMGVRNADVIAARLIAHGRDPATPVAVIENGTRADQRTLYGRLDGLADLLRDNAVRAPALLVIGEVVGAAAAADTLPADLLAAE